MSPEVLMQGRVSKASDVYSFGILRECVCPGVLHSLWSAARGYSKQLPGRQCKGVCRRAVRCLDARKHRIGPCLTLHTSSHPACFVRNLSPLCRCRTTCRTVFELYTGQQAYSEIPPPMLAYHVATAGGRPHLPAHCPAPYRLLAEACWAAQPADRWVQSCLACCTLLLSGRAAAAAAAACVPLRFVACRLLSVHTALNVCPLHLRNDTGTCATPPCRHQDPFTMPHVSAPRTHRPLRPTFKEAYEALRAMTSVTQHHLLHLPASATSPASPRSPASAAAAAAAADLAAAPGGAQASAAAAAAGVAPACASPKGPSAAASSTSIPLAATAGGDGAAPGRLCSPPANGASGPSVAVTVLNVNAMHHNALGNHSNKAHEPQLLFDSGSGAHGVRNGTGTGATSSLAVSSIPATGTAAAATAAGHPSNGSGADSANATVRSGGTGGVVSGGHSRTAHAAVAAFNAAVSSFAAAMAQQAEAAPAADGGSGAAAASAQGEPAAAVAAVPLVQQAGFTEAPDASATGARS